MTLDKKHLLAESRFQKGTQQLTEKANKKAPGTSQLPLQEAGNVNTQENRLSASYQ